MFDFHIHSTVSFDGRGTAEQMAAAAKEAGLQEICFTDHIDYPDFGDNLEMVFDLKNYRSTYENLQVPGLVIRHGVEFGITPLNLQRIKTELAKYPYDFVIGSVHFVDGVDVYEPEYWQGMQTAQAYRRYLEEMVRCVRLHEDYDVLGHLTYIAKCGGNPNKIPLQYREFSDLIDEILNNLVQKGLGLEVNTSGVDRCGVFLPDETIVRRFKELGGEIVTVGSDAHDPERVGQYTDRACAMLKDIFGYVCTFRNRKPVFHRL